MQYAKNDIPHLYFDEKKNASEIAPLIGMSLSGITYYLRSHGYKLRSRGESGALIKRKRGRQRIDITEEDRLEIVRLYKNKEGSVRQIASKYKLSMGATRSILVWRGVKMRSSSEGLKIRYPNGRFGELHGMWNGGSSFLPYSCDFNEKLKEFIRIRDGRVCQLCGKSEEQELKERKAKLCVNHIDFNKNNCSPENLNTLCNKCNVGICKDRNYWTIYFQEKQIERGIVKPLLDKTKTESDNEIK
jgi:hypothetical protein